jgi:Helix-turn-helix domain
MLFSPAAPQTQDRAAPAQEQRTSRLATVVTNGHLREQFRWAALRAKMPDTMFRTAMALTLHFNCKTGQCNPRRETLAEEIGLSERQVGRAIADLEAAGWLMRKRGGRDDTVNYTLCIPA